MVRLTTQSPFDMALPVSIGAATLRELPVDLATTVAAFPGQDVSEALFRQIGVSMPTPGQVLKADAASVLWTGPAEALVRGAALTPIDGALICDQSDGWAWLALEGPDAGDVLARLVPLDLETMAVGTTARSLLGHMTVSIVRDGAERFEIGGFRSMAKTMVQELQHAMTGVNARRIGGK